MCKYVTWRYKSTCFWRVFDGQRVWFEGDKRSVPPLPRLRRLRSPSLVPTPRGERYLADDLLRVHSSEVSACRGGFNDVGVELFDAVIREVPSLSPAHFRNTEI